MTQSNSQFPVETPDAQALCAIQAVRPYWSGVHRVANVTSGPAMRVYHAGPTFQSAQTIPYPVLNSMAYAVLFERWAQDFDAAREMVLCGEVKTLACQDADLLVPLAGVLSPSMAVLEISDIEAGQKSIYVAINEGQLHAMRLGKRDEGLVAHLRWLNGNFSEWLGGCLSPALALLPIMEQALALGDDCHARTVEGSALLRNLMHKNTHSESQSAREFLLQSPAFALNLWMGAAALCLRAAEGIVGAELVTRVGGNGSEFGIQLAGNAGVWVCETAPKLEGVIETQYAGRQAAGALGDSAVVDFLGLGGQALAHAPQVVKGLETVLPADALQRGLSVLQSVPSLSLIPNAVSARQCEVSGVGPLVLLGMIDKSGTAGRIGGGCVQVSSSLLSRALHVKRHAEVRDAA